MAGLGLDDYGSDSDADNDVLPPSSKPPLSLPPPSKINNTSKAFKRPPKKITIGLPSLPPTTTSDDHVEKPPAKKPRLQSGSSSLLSMLPPPKQELPTPGPTPSAERVLGGGQRPGLIFNTPVPPPAANCPEALGKDSDPPQIAGDFFSLGPATSVDLAKPTATPKVESTAPPMSISSAPRIEEFVPPEPTATDPYPGYYLLPSGAWAAYDPEYYQSFYQKWQQEYHAHVRALEKGAVKGFEDLESSDAHEVDAQKVMERAKREIQDREERKAITHGASGAPTAPRMNIQGAKLGARARSRHQLTTLLSEAYSNREALEEKIAEGRRNRKEAGNKYGF